MKKALTVNSITFKVSLSVLEPLHKYSDCSTYRKPVMAQPSSLSISELARSISLVRSSRTGCPVSMAIVRLPGLAQPNEKRRTGSGHVSSFHFFARSRLLPGLSLRSARIAESKLWQMGRHPEAPLEYLTPETYRESVWPNPQPLDGKWY